MHLALATCVTNTNTLHQRVYTVSCLQKNYKMTMHTIMHSKTGFIKWIPKLCLHFLTLVNILKVFQKFIYFILLFISLKLKRHEALFSSFIKITCKHCVAIHLIPGWVLCNLCLIISMNESPKIAFFLNILYFFLKRLGFVNYGKKKKVVLIIMYLYL